jgi:hypothetical protein
VEPDGYLQEKGDVFNGPLTPEQRAQYRRDFLATDEYYRQSSGNTFKLDLDTFSPVRIEDGLPLTNWWAGHVLPR